MMEQLMNSQAKPGVFGKLLAAAKNGAPMASRARPMMEKENPIASIKDKLLKKKAQDKPLAMKQSPIMPSYRPLGLSKPTSFQGMTKNALNKSQSSQLAPEK